MCLVLWRFLLILLLEVFHFFWGVFRFGFLFFRHSFSCARVRVRAFAGVCVCSCALRAARLYIHVQTGAGVWFSRLSSDECIFCLWFQKVLMYLSFPETYSLVSPSPLFSSLSSPLCLPSLLLCSLIQMCLAQL